MSMNKPQPVRNNEKGFASLVVALIMIIVLSLLMVGFARLARREQQSSLDKQLAVQAYYAAETGINDLTKAIPTLNAYQKTNVIDQNACLSDIQITAINALAGTNGTPKLPSSDVDPTNGISYTCALINTRPESLVKSGLGAQSAWETNFSTTGDLKKMTVSWGHKGHYTFRTDPTPVLTPKAEWDINTPAVLQFSITPLDSVDRDALINSTFTAYLYPSAGGGSVVYVAPSTNPGGNAPIVPGDCKPPADGVADESYTCNVTISGLPGVAGSYYMVRIVGYYDTSDISIHDFLDTGGTHLHTVDGQAQLDVTGKAKNVLKRLQVRTPIGKSLDTDFTLPSAAIESQATCKRMATYPGSTTYDTSTYASNACDLSAPRP
ncbi:MAG: hypothetical protein JWL89_728 [Candidatus Saccharibacteria bacterium]|nr:hypothetical protein [Candidatus Saccharibacteria bacterium]